MPLLSLTSLPPFVLFSLSYLFNLKMILPLLTSFLPVLFCTRGQGCSRRSLRCNGKREPWFALQVRQTGNPSRASCTCIRFQRCEASGGRTAVSPCWSPCEESSGAGSGDVLIAEVLCEQRLNRRSFPDTNPLFSPIPSRCPAFCLWVFLWQKGHSR